MVNIIEGYKSEDKFYVFDELEVGDIFSWGTCVDYYIKTSENHCAPVGEHYLRSSEELKMQALVKFDYDIVLKGRSVQ